MSRESSWDKYVLEALWSIQKQNNTREFGKLVQHGNEVFQRDWIEGNTSLKIATRDDGDVNESGYDHVTTQGLRIQCKYRVSELHLENTRRHSKKNKGAASKSGHTAYSVGEADVYVFTRPRDKNKEALMAGVEGAELLAIPEYELEDPKNPGFLKTRVLKPLQEKYQGRAIEILERMNRKNANK